MLTGEAVFLVKLYCYIHEVIQLTYEKITCANKINILYAKCKNDNLSGLFGLIIIIVIINTQLFVL